MSFYEMLGVGILTVLIVLMAIEMIVILSLPDRE